MIWVVSEGSRTRDELVPLLEARRYAVTHLDCADNVPHQAMFRRPALIIVDCGVHGSLDLVSTLRGDPRTQPIPLIMFATSELITRDEALARGADAFVQKRSLDWAELFPEIQRLGGPPPVADAADSHRVQA